MANIISNIITTALEKIANKVNNLNADGTNTKYPTVTAVRTHTTDTANPHGVTKAQVGLSNVDDVKQYPNSNPSGFETPTQLDARDTANRARANHTGTQAISTVTGLQTALDGKQATLVSGTNIKTINGASVLGSGDITVGGSSSLDIGTTPIINGTVGRIPFQGAGNVLQQDSGLFWDNVNKRFGVNQPIPTARLHVKAADATATAVARVENNAGTGDLFKIHGDGWLYNYGNVDIYGRLLIENNTGLSFRPTNINASVQLRPVGNHLQIRPNDGSILGMTFDQVGNVGVNTITPTAKLHVKAADATSTVVARVENSAGTSDIFRVAGDGSVYGIGVSNNDSQAFYGNLAGTTITSGSSNTIIGYLSGRFLVSGSAMTSANQCVYLGALIRSNTNGVLNEIVLGYNARGNGNNSMTLGADTITKTIIYGSVGLSNTTPTAKLHLPAGTATAGTAPIKLTAGTNMTTPEAGAIEFDGADFFVTNTSGRASVTTSDKLPITVTSSSPQIVDKAWFGSQAQYDALGVYDSATIYNII